jgi:hypothetical protein
MLVDCVFLLVCVAVLEFILVTIDLSVERHISNSLPNGSVKLDDVLTVVWCFEIQRRTFLKRGKKRSIFFAKSKLVLP